MNDNNLSFVFKLGICIKRKCSDSINIISRRPRSKSQCKGSNITMQPTSPLLSCIQRKVSNNGRGTQRKHAKNLFTSNKRQSDIQHIWATGMQLFNSLLILSSNFFIKLS